MVMFIRWALLLTATAALAQQQQFADLGDLRLESAETIRNNEYWNNGNYTVQPKLLAVHYMHQFAVETTSRANRSAFKPISDPGTFDANDWLRQLELTSDCGHLAPGCEASRMNSAIQAFLK